MTKQGVIFWLLTVLVLTVSSACQREGPAEKVESQTPQASRTIEQGAQQTVEGIQGPMDKARSVEGTLEKAAEAKGEQIQSTTP